VALSDLRYYDVISEQMLLEDGNYIFMVGPSSGDIRQEVPISIRGEYAPVRDPFSYTKALCYDDYRNVRLHRGEKKADGSYSICVCPKPSVEAAGRYSSCKITYGDFFFPKSPTKIRLVVLPLEVCKLVVYADMAMIASEDYAAEDTYSTKEIAVNPDKVILNKNVSVQIQIYGRMNIVGFEFI